MYDVKISVCLICTYYQCLIRENMQRIKWKSTKDVQATNK